MAIFTYDGEIRIIEQWKNTRYGNLIRGHYITYEVIETGKISDAPAYGFAICEYADGGRDEIWKTIHAAQWGEARYK